MLMPACKMCNADEWNMERDMCSKSVRHELFDFWPISPSHLGYSYVRECRISPPVCQYHCGGCGTVGGLENLHGVWRTSRNNSTRARSRTIA